MSEELLPPLKKETKKTPTSVLRSRMAAIDAENYDNYDLAIESGQPILIQDPINPTDHELLLLQRLGSIHCSPREVSQVTGVTEAMLKKNHMMWGAYERGIELGKMRLRRAQWNNAIAGDVTMQIFLGKNMLGQSDKGPVKDDTDDKGAKQVFADKLQNLLNSGEKRQIPGKSKRRGKRDSQEAVAIVGEK